MPDCDNHAATFTLPGWAIAKSNPPRIEWTDDPTTLCCTCDAVVTPPEPEEPAE